MGLNILLVGSGGREHTLAWKIAMSPLLDTLYCAPGNAGMAAMTAVSECVSIDGEDFPAMAAFAREKKIDLAVIGPEVPLVAGLGDCLREAGIAVFGPSKAAAALEGSKAYMKGLLKRAGIASAAYETFRDSEAALTYIRQPWPMRKRL